MVTVNMPGDDTPINVGQIVLTRFINPAGLKSIGGNLLKQTAASGEAIDNIPGNEGMATIQHKFIENSGVNVVDEMVEMNMPTPNVVKRKRKARA